MKRVNLYYLLIIILCFAFAIIVWAADYGADQKIDGLAAPGSAVTRSTVIPVQDPADTDKIAGEDIGTIMGLVQLDDCSDLTGEGTAGVLLDDGDGTFSVGTDLSSLSLTLGPLTGVLLNTPQAKTYNADDTSETVGTDITSSIVFITTDNDSTDETIDIQDGTADGQFVTFFCVSGCDGTDDSVIIDVETDSTCTGCPTSGIFELGTNGDNVTIVWDDTASAWYFSGSYIQ